MREKSFKTAGLRGRDGSREEEETVTWGDIRRLKLGKELARLSTGMAGGMGSRLQRDGE